jgi:hypothetical protein
MKIFNVFFLLLFLSIQIYCQEKSNSQAPAFRKNEIKTVQKFLLKAFSKSGKVDTFLVSSTTVNKYGMITHEMLYDSSGRVVTEYFAKYLDDSLIIESKSSIPDLKMTFEYNDLKQIKSEKTFLGGRLASIKTYYYKNDTLEKTEKYFLKDKKKNVAGSFERNTYLYDRQNDITTIKEEKSTQRKNELSESTTIIRWSQDKRTQSFWVTDRMSPKWFMTERKINYKEELKDTQEQFYRTNAFMNQDGVRISLSRGDKLLTENLHHANDLIRESKIFRNSELMVRYLFQYLKD